MARRFESRRSWHQSLPLLGIHHAQRIAHPQQAQHLGQYNHMRPNLHMHALRKGPSPRGVMLCMNHGFSSLTLAHLNWWPVCIHPTESHVLPTPHKFPCSCICTLARANLAQQQPLSLSFLHCMALQARHASNKQTHCCTHLNAIIVCVPASQRLSCGELSDP